MAGPRALLALLALIVALTSNSCGVSRERVQATSLGAPDGGSAERELQITPGEMDVLSDRPDLVERIRTHPYAYFRLLSGASSRRVCAEFGDLDDRMPLVNLHGDAHLEQYAVTPDAHGLDDFDEAGTGPAVVDLVRFASSIHFGCRLATFECDPNAAVEAFLDAYSEGLADPTATVATPAWVARARSGIPPDAARFIAWAESLMQKPDPAVRSRMVERWELFAHTMAALDPERSGSYYRIDRFGSIGIGIGSAVDPKFLLRIRGETEAPEDDLIVEIKPMNEVTATCLYRPPAGGLFLTLLPQARMGRLRPRVLGYLPWDEERDDGTRWWVHSWDYGYRELDVTELRSQSELEEIAHDVGLQLGRGHCNGIAAPLEDLHRLLQLRSLDSTRKRVTHLARRMADEAYQGWLRQMAPDGSTPGGGS